MPKQLTVVFCLPGSSYSGKFLECWTGLVSFCLLNNIRPILIQRQSCNIYFVRNMCLGADVSRGKDQKPFDGKLDYDYLMWIDSDCLFNPQQFMKLLSHDKDIVSGIYLMEGGTAFASVINWDEEYFKRNHCFQFLTPNDLQGKEDLIEVSYTGMGFMLIKKGVFESMEYPWFRPIEKRIGEMVDFTTEDVGFCLTAREKGFSVWIDPQVRVGHEKKVVL
jgi:hypothetical protein